jgi:transposase InsO family protein
VLNQERIDLILVLRDERKLDPKRIQAELLRQHDLRLSTATIWKVLHAHERAPLVRRRPPETPRRYSRPLPGDRGQVDTMKITEGRFQYTAIDDCTRLRVLGLYPPAHGQQCGPLSGNSDAGGISIPDSAHSNGSGHRIFRRTFSRYAPTLLHKFRPNRPRAPHLNGKVERSQQTDWNEFYSSADLGHSDLPQRLEEWQFFYNWHRPHSALNGHTPMERCCQLLEQTPLLEEIETQYDAKRERAKVRDFCIDRRLAELKGCV